MLPLYARYAQLQHMLRGQNDYSIPEKQQELRSFVGELDANAFKDSNGSEVPFLGPRVSFWLENMATKPFAWAVLWLRRCPVGMAGF